MSGDLALSRPLLHWLRGDAARWATLPWTQRARLTWAAHWGSLNARLAAGAAAPAAALQDPVLIVGPWRSGTTAMHELFAAATGLPTPQTWQCMNACAFALGRPPRDGVALARPMDGIEIRADSPQEDEFALLTLGVDSAYRAFWMPHRIGELGPTLDPAHWLADADWLPAWERFLVQVRASLGAPAAQPLLLKSPNHSFRLPAILGRFPGSRLVWMARPAAEVFASNRKMWQTMFAAHGLTAPDPVALDHFLARALEACAGVLDWCRERLPARQWQLVSQPQLQRDGAALALAVAERLALPAAASPALAAAQQRLAQGRIERHAAVVEAPAAVHAAIARLDLAQDRARAAQGGVTGAI